MEYILKTDNLSKSFRNRIAVDNISIKIGKGEIYGFLGKNGAGKTTTMRLILGLVRPDRGNIELFGEECRFGRQRHYSRIGSIIDTPGFYPNLTGYENLEIHRRMTGEPDRKKVAIALEKTGLYDESRKLVRHYSLGMKQRLGIARAILHSPELLILDEPVNGLDPKGIRDMRKLFISLSRDFGVSIFISSHILNEIEQLADRICIIDEGKIIEEIDSAKISVKNRKYLKLEVNDDKKASLVLETKLKVREYKIISKGIFQIYEKLDSRAVLIKELVYSGIDILECSIEKDTLEDYFLALTGDSYAE